MGDAPLQGTLFGSEGSGGEERPEEVREAGRGEPGPVSEAGPGSPLSVSELNERVRALLQGGMGTVWVEGELSGIRYYGSGRRTRVYGTLKDADAEVRIVLWPETVGALDFRLEDGQKVLVQGDVTLYAQRGQYQLTIRQVRPSGVGELELAFQQLKEKLEEEGLFAPERKRPLPRYPFRVGVVTSLQAAALRDFLEVTGRRNPALRVLIAPSRVQGEGAAEEIVRALEGLQRAGDVDLAVLTRGGGSLEDLWPFNEEVVARAVAASSLPVVSAVGHETDWTICDLAADHRSPTPSAAAERAAWIRDDVRQVLDEFLFRADRSLERRLDGMQKEVLYFTRAHGFQRMRSRLTEAMGRVEEGLRRLPVSLRHRIARARDRLDGVRKGLGEKGRRSLELRDSELRELVRTMNALGPPAVLERGYAIARRSAGGPVVRSAGELRPGDRLQVCLLEGSVMTRVEEKGPGLEALTGLSGGPEEDG
ncbi:MAG: exodeoxyribonuclease VII large subunit [bacterium]